MKQKPKPIDSFKQPIPENLKDIPEGIGILDIENYIKQQEFIRSQWDKFPMKYTQYYMLREQEAKLNVQKAKHRLKILEYIISKGATAGGLKLLQDPFLSDVKELSETLKEDTEFFAK